MPPVVKTAVEHTSVQILGVFAWQEKNKGLERSLKTAIPQEVYGESGKGDEYTCMIAYYPCFP